MACQLTQQRKSSRDAKLLNKFHNKMTHREGILRACSRMSNSICLKQKKCNSRAKFSLFLLFYVFFPPLFISCPGGAGSGSFCVSDLLQQVYMRPVLLERHPGGHLGFEINLTSWHFSSYVMQKNGMFKESLVFLSLFFYRSVFSWL